MCLFYFITWRAIEWKSYDRSLYDYETLGLENDEDEEIPITEQIKMPQQTTPIALVIIEIVEAQDDVEENVIISSETDERGIIELEDVEIEEEHNDVDVAFNLIEDVSIFPVCKKVKKSKRRACL